MNVSLDQKENVLLNREGVLNTQRLLSTARLCTGVVFAAILGLPMSSVADDADKSWRFQLGANLASMTWSGENGENGGNDFSSESRRIGFQFSARKELLYMGVSVNSGEYLFEDGEPDREPVDGASSAVEPTIEMGQLDLTLGYFVLPRLSLFVGIKNYGLTWQEPDYKVNYSGVGGGASGFYPLSHDWLLYGSLGVANLTAKSDNQEIGSGQVTNLEFGGLYQWQPNAAFTVGLQSQSINLSLDNGDEQNHQIGGLLLGVQYALGSE